MAQVASRGADGSYLLRESDPLFDGDVVSIAPKEAVFKQVVSDSTGSRPFREGVKSLPGA